jgi:prevent-host-death family protein
MAELVPVSEAKARLSELIRDSDREDILLMRHSHPVAVLLSTRRYEDLLERLDDLEDRLAVHEAEGEDVTVPWEKLKIEMGWSLDSDGLTA